MPFAVSDRVKPYQQQAMKALNSAKPYQQQAAKALSFFHKPGDNDRIELASIPELNFDRETMIALCLENPSAKQKIEHFRDDLSTIKKAKERELKKMGSVYGDPKVRRGAFSLAGSLLAYKLLPSVWHLMTDAKEDTLARERLEPGFVMSTLKFVMFGGAGYQLFMANRLKNHAEDKKALKLQISELGTRIAKYESVLDEVEKIQKEQAEVPSVVVAP